MPDDLTAVAFVSIDAPRSVVWNALIDPKSIKEYMFGADIETDWKVGSPVTWKGQSDGRRYEDRGKILTYNPESVLTFSHQSGSSGIDQLGENYHHVTIELTSLDGKTRVALTQDNNLTSESRDHSEKNWKTILENLKKFVESTDGKRTAKQS